jgi:kynurenine formamidase
MAYFPNLFPGTQLIDLTHTLGPTIPTWEGTCGLQTVCTNDYDNIFRVQKITLNAGLGTHIDFPAHIVPGGIDASQVGFRDLQAPCTVFYANANDNAEFILSKSDIEAFEKNHGVIRPHSWFIVMFGWGKRWSDPAGYRNIDTAGIMHFPKIDADAAQLLIDRQIVGVGVDTLSPDGGDEKAQLLHQAFLPKKIFILENLKFHEGLPTQGGHLLVSHLLIKGGTESPAHVIFSFQTKTSI